MTRGAKSADRYRTLFRLSPDALVVIAADGRVTDASDAAGRLYGRPAADLIGCRSDELWAGAPAPMDEDESGIRVWRAAGLRADGTSFPQEATVARLDLDGERCDLVRIRDLTEQEQLQEELVQAQKMEAIGQLVSGVAHELNNPLAAIIAFSQLIRTDPRLPSDLRRDADLLVGEADRTRRIVQSLLDFARQRPPERHPTSLRNLVESVLDLQAYTLNTGEVLTEVDIPPDLPHVPIDRAQMQQVLLNLTINAIQAIGQTGTRGTIRIAARVEGPAGRLVRLSVSDDGPGVRPEDRERLFVPFFTTKEPGEGTGLGLPVSFGIVAAHGGHLTYEPGPGGTGSTFVVTLPLDPVRVSAPAGDRARSARSSLGVVRGRQASDEGPNWVGPEQTAHPGAAGGAANPRPDSRPRVLVLDDEPSIRAFLAKALRTAGFEPVVSGDGEDALRHVRERSFEAVLCDHRMAGMNGIEIFESIVAIRPELSHRFVLMSGDVLNPDLGEFTQTHEVALLAKPFDLETVTRTVRAIATSAFA